MKNRILCAACVAVFAAALSVSCSSGSADYLPPPPYTGTGTGPGSGAGFDITATYEPAGVTTTDADWFADMVRVCSSDGFAMMSGNQLYIRNCTISKGSSGDVVVVNLDWDHTSSGIYGYASGVGYNHQLYVGGRCLHVTFLHEFGHARMNLSDHYGTTIQCIMNASSGGIYMWSPGRYCSGTSYDCWPSIRDHWSLEDRTTGGTPPPATNVTITF